MSGMIDYEGQDPFREQMQKLVKKIKTDTASKRLIFNLQDLEFVGSSGITNFIQTLKEVNSSMTGNRPVYRQVRTEFQKLIRAFDEDASFEIEATPHAAARKPS